MNTKQDDPKVRQLDFAFVAEMAGAIQKMLTEKCLAADVAQTGDVVRLIEMHAALAHVVALIIESSGTNAGLLATGFEAMLMVERIKVRKQIAEWDRESKRGAGGNGDAPIH